jgi:hypothetical protein
LGTTAIDSTINGVDITVPTDPSQSIAFGTPSGQTVSIDLPFAESASGAEVVADGVVTYDNNNSSSTAPVVKDDGSLQVVTVIDSATAPTRYPYELTLPAGTEIVASGDVLLFVDDEKLVGGLAPAWAKDADGRDVPTRYEINGLTITQVVEHNGANFTYPIVADPWLGVALFSRITVDTYRSQPRVNLDLSRWGWAVYTGGGPVGFAAGQVILNTAGWDEAWGKGGTVRAALDKPSQRQQFSCHALGAVAAGTWNLEKYRPNRKNGDWGFGVAIHRCNWETADRY